MTIRIFNGALDLVEIDGKESLALRGVVDPIDLANILTPEYQREVLSASKIHVLKRALKTSRVPDIDLGMRGSAARETTESGQNIWLLDDDVYVIDGLQRITAGRELVDEGLKPHIGVIVHFDTTEAWERARFEALNIGQTGLSNNVTLRNMAKSHLGAAVMHDITHNKKFVLCDRITWSQNMHRGDMITAITFYKVVGRLHSHLGPGRSDPRSLARTGVQKIIERAGKGHFVQNTLTFFELIDECFGIKNVAYRRTAVQLKTTFLAALAGMLSDHENFWEGNTLVVPLDLRRKLAKFPISDPSVMTLASSSGMAIKTLEIMLADHLNYNKRTRRLTLRATAEVYDNLEQDDENAGVA